MSDGRVTAGSAPATRLVLTITAARRLAISLFALCLVVDAAVIVFELVTESPGNITWGSGNTIAVVGFALAVLCFPVVGMLITYRQPHSTIGWLMLVIGVIWAWAGLSDGYVLYAVHIDPGSLPNPALMAALSSWTWVPAIGLTGCFLILLFPNGHLPSPRWRVVAWVSAVTIAGVSFSTIFRPGELETVVPGLTNPLGLEALAPVLSVVDALIFLLPVCILACATGLVVKFRRSRAVERLQLKWLAAAGSLVGALSLVTVVTSMGAGDAGTAPSWILALQDAELVSFGLIPIAIGVAILRYRLYDIDVVINKALVFGILASFITAVYVGLVVGVGSLVGRGNQPNLALSIAATAVVAVAFQPVRDKVQRLANRLVYGARATPYEVLSDFADRMGGTYDAADLLPMMARTVAQGVGARQVDVWLCIGSGFVPEASWPPSSEETATAPPESVEDIVSLVGDRIVEVRHHGELLGAMTVVKPSGEPITPAEDKLLDDVAVQAGLVLRNVRLIEELRSSRHRLVSTQDEERRRLERNLHDGAQQSLVSVALMLRTARVQLGGDGDTLGPALDTASEQLAVALAELRELARGIHPAILTERGLGPAIRSLAERSPVPVVVDYQLDVRPDKSIERTLYFVVAEALTNVAKYAEAAEVAVSVIDSGDAIVLDLSDDGVGGADRSRGSGLRGLADRVAVVDGTLEIHSPPGVGTRLTCRIPIRSLPFDGLRAREGDGLRARGRDANSDQSPTATPTGAGQ